MLRRSLRDDLLEFITESERGEEADFTLSREDAVDVISHSRLARRNDRLDASDWAEEADRGRSKPPISAAWITHNRDLAKQIRDREYRAHDRIRTFDRVVRADGARIPVGVLVARGAM